MSLNLFNTMKPTCYHRGPYGATSEGRCANRPSTIVHGLKKLHDNVQNDPMGDKDIINEKTLWIVVKTAFGLDSEGKKSRELKNYGNFLFTLLTKNSCNSASHGKHLRTGRAVKLRTKLFSEVVIEVVVFPVVLPKLTALDLTHFIIPRGTFKFLDKKYTLQS